MKRPSPRTVRNRLRKHFHDAALREPGVDAAMAKRIAARQMRNLGELTALIEQLHLAGAAGKVPPPKPIVKSFDPYAFGAVVILERHGPDVLLTHLDGIDDVGHLRQLAEAQHLSVDPAITQVPDLRSAILRGAEERIAERRAAAS